MNECPVSTLRQVANELGLSGHAVIKYFHNGTLVGKKWAMESGRPGKPNQINLIERDWKIDVKRIGKHCREQTKIVIENIKAERRA
jgi:hypothetical protein